MFDDDDDDDVPRGADDDVPTGCLVAAVVGFVLWLGFYFVFMV